EAADFGLSEIVDQKTSNRNFRTYIDKDRDRPKDQVGMSPDRIVHLLADFVLGVLDLGYFESTNRDRQQDQRDTQSDIWHLHGCRFVQAIGECCIRSHRADLIGSLGRGTQDEEASEER